MKKIYIVIIIILFVILAFKIKDSFSINIGSKTAPVNTTNPPSSNFVQGGSLETKESSEGSVTVAVTPQSLDPSSSTWDFEIALNTHSEELNEDLTTISELIDDQGKLYKPASWEGAPAGGHHRQGILKFNPISPKPKSLELKIRNVGGIEERSFKWNL